MADCPVFFTGTVPIMWNDGFIKEYFNPDGLILWKNIDELPKILDTLDKSLYNKLMPFIQENFNTAKKYSIIEDYLYAQFFHKFDK